MVEILRYLIEMATVTQIKLLAITLLAALLIMGDVAMLKNAFANSSSASGSASVKIVKPAEMNKERDLDFGQVDREKEGGFAMMEPSEESIHFTGDLSKADANDFHSAELTVSGHDDQKIAVVLPDMDDDQLLFRKGGHEFMRMKSLDFAEANPNDPAVQDDQFSFRVGATVGVHDEQVHAPGHYEGNFEVTVAFE